MNVSYKKMYNLLVEILQQCLQESVLQIKFKLEMVQRYQHRTFQEELIIAREQLAPNYQQLQQIALEQLSSAHAADIILAMINRLSSPIIGSNIIRNDLYEIQFPYMAQYEMILDKAEHLYYQSIVQDLNRIRNNEVIMQINKEEIKRCVQQLNWKVNLEKSSILNDSQEIGQNMDLMKFFQGVRNYQNWSDHIKKNCIEKLKEEAHVVQNNLAFKQGFILLKLANQIQKIQAGNKSALFTINKTYSKGLKLINKINKIEKNIIKAYFKSIVDNTLKKSPEMKLKEMFGNFIQKKNIIQIKRFKNEVKNRLHAYGNSINKIQNLIAKKQIHYRSIFFHKLNVDPMIKATKITNFFEIVEKFSKKFGVKVIMSALKIPTRIIFNILNNKYSDKLQLAFKKLKENDIQIRLERPKVSYRIKGKILASLNKYQKQPINIKKTFSKWYLNTHETIFSKKIYNIWLKGNTSKFTVFMRLKNMVDMINKHKISKEMKDFIKILCDKYQKFQEFNKKKMLKKWIENTRRIRKIEKTFTLLTDITDQTYNLYKKIAIDKIVNVSQQKKIIKNYCNRYLHQYVQNIKLSLQKWRNINNIKKQWGKKRLRALILHINAQVTMTERQTFNILKQNRVQGRQLKMIQCRKAINKDSIFLQRFFQLWRTNKSQLMRFGEQKIENKQKSTFLTQRFANRMTNSSLKYAFSKILQSKQLKQTKIRRFQTSFIKSIQRQQQYNKLYILNIFKQNWREGKLKKQRLIMKLVNANVIKQKVGLLIMKNKSQEMTFDLKRQKCSLIFSIMESKMKENYLIFNKRLFIDKVLRKIVLNYTENVKISYNAWKSMPLRMRWKLRTKVINFQNNLISFMNKRLNQCNQSFKSSLLAAKLKQKKAIYIMACKYQNILKKYFLRYHQNVMKIKNQQKIDKANTIFQNLEERIKHNFRNIFKNPSEWGKKSESLIMLDGKVKKRLLDYLIKWQKNAQSLKYYNKLMNQKKKRCLQLFSKVILSNQGREIKKTIQSFHKNSRIMQFQIHFLKKLCDSQAGKIIKGFNQWKTMPQPKNKQKIGKATRFQSNLHRLVIRNLKITLNVFKDCHYFGNENKKYCIRKLVATSCSGIAQYFVRWRQNKKLIMIYEKNRKLQHIFETIQKKQKENYQLLLTGDQGNKRRKSMNIIQNWWNKQQKYYIKRWFTNTNKLKLKDISKKHLLLNLKNIKQKHEHKKLNDKVISKFVINKNVKSHQKKVLRSQNVLNIIQTYEKNKRVLLVTTIDRLKFQHIKGNFCKNKAFQKFLNQKIAQVHKMLDVWNKLTQYTKQMHKQRIVSENMNSLFEIVKNNYSTILSKTRETLIKKSSLQKIFKAQQIKYKGMFDLWRQRVKELKLLAQLDKNTKTSILEKINKILSSTSKDTVVATIRKFHMNSKIQKVQKRFIEKLLHTKSGKTVHAFNSWKTIPNTNLSGKYKKYQKFYFRMENFYLQRLKCAHKIFNESNENGNLMKKQSILKLFEMTSLGIRRYYNRWTRLTKEKMILLSVNATFKALESASLAIADQYKIVFQDQRSYNLKISAIQKLIKASRGTTQNYFNLWRDRIRELSFMEKMGNDQKTQALKMFTNVIGNSQTGQIMNIIQKFQKNASIVKISRKFFNKLMTTKTGKVISFFDKLKTIPDAKINKLKKKGIIFQSRLNNFVIQRLRFALSPYKDCVYEASVKKKYCLDRLLKACMGQNKKKFLIWRNVVRQGKMLVHTSIFQKVFTNMQNVYKNNYQLISKDANVQMQKKKNLCRKLINNSLFVQHHAYMLWKQAYRIDNININKRQTINTMHLRNLIGVFDNNQNKKIIQAVGSFRKILQLRTFEDYDYYKNYKHTKVLTFYDNMKMFHNNKMAIFINALKSNMVDISHADKSQKILSAFQVIAEAIRNNLDQIMKTEKNTKLLNKMFYNLFENTILDVRKTFNLWRQKNKQKRWIQDALNKLKKKMILQLQRILKGYRQAYILNAIKNLKANTKIMQIKKEYRLKIIKIKSSNVQIAFSRWKNLPYQQAKKLKNKATLFQKGLVNLMMQRLKQVNDCFKKNHVEGVIKKQNATRSIVRSKTLDMNRLFFKWRRFNNEKLVTLKIITLDKTFSILQDTFTKNINIFQGNKMQDHSKIQVATNLFNNNVKRLREYLLIWRKSTKMQKYHHLQRLLRNFNPEDYNKRLMRIGWLMIEKKKDIEMMKGYINSLWKWKLSNIQATYYTKFIKVFKESQELIKLSNLLNKKIYENVHHGFRNVLNSGQSNRNRKRQIVEKYFTRKIRYYFNSFKDAITRQQINVWRSKYTDNIKGKITTDILSSIFNRIKNQSFSKLASYYNYTNQIIKFKEAINNYSQNNLSLALHKMYNDKYLVLSNTIQSTVSTNKEGNIKDAFLLLKMVFKVQKMRDIITKVINKNNKLFGFNRIYLKKERVIKSTLSLNLLETLLHKTSTTKIKDSISQISKNRRKNIAAIKINNIIGHKQKAYFTYFVEKSLSLINMRKFLQRFNRGKLLLKILDRQELKLKKQYLDRMRQKQNKWMQLSIQKFATRASIRSSPAVSLWRLKTYIINS